MSSSLKAANALVVVIRLVTPVAEADSSREKEEYLLVLQPAVIVVLEVFCLVLIYSSVPFDWKNRGTS